MPACVKSVANGFTKEEHYTMATKIGDLFKNANLVAVEPDRDSDLNSNVEDVKRFAVEFNLNGNTGIALMIVKNTQNAGHKLYSVELAELIKKGSRNLAAVKENPNNTQPIGSPFDENIAHIDTVVNEKIELSDFPEEFQKGKWKKQFKVFADYLNEQNGIDSRILNVYKNLKNLKFTLPFAVKKPVIKMEDFLFG